jgi:hypothetical protein
MERAQDQIPGQETGRQTDFSEHKSFNDRKHAHDCFRKAAEKLLQVNHWHEYAGTASSKFTMTNNLGDEVTGFAREGFYFNIDVPMIPGSNAGDGLEWVMIEKIEAQGDEKSEEEYITMTARPVPDPRKSDPEIAHFFKDASTSTFIVKREGVKVSAEVHGRNETPNNDEVALYDKVRNTLVALSARIGLSGPQWKILVKGLLEDCN